MTGTRPGRPHLRDAATICPDVFHVVPGVDLRCERDVGHLEQGLKHKHGPTLWGKPTTPAAATDDAFQVGPLRTAIGIVADQHKGTHRCAWGDFWHPEDGLCNPGKVLAAHRQIITMYENACTTRDAGSVSEWNHATNYGAASVLGSIVEEILVPIYLLGET